MNELAVSKGDEIMENVLIKGDLSRLTPKERADYYAAVCRSAGLNPLTKPFEYITLNNKLTLYALRACTDQLRAIHNVSVEELTESERDGVFVVTAKVRNGDGRTDMAKGAVMINGLKGDVLANALMKAETKAKRRATLSLCGLGFLDETELETIPAAARKPVAAPSSLHPPKTLPPHDPKTGEVLDDGLDIPQDLDRRPKNSNPKPKAIAGDPDPETILKWIDDKLSSMKGEVDLTNFWNDRLVPRIGELFPPDREEAANIYSKHLTRVRQ
jgi:hypothetical protein